MRSKNKKDHTPESWAKRLAQLREKKARHSERLATGEARPWKNEHPQYQTWRAMIRRCTEPKNPQYKDYGARGISVCDRWRLSFEHFIADMGERPRGMELDRIDNNGNYEPSNCRWATKVQNMRNRRNTWMVTLRGETKPLGEWVDAVGIPYPTVQERLYRGWTPEMALMTKTSTAGK